MENKINIAELLKDCPMGMELDCTMYDNVTFEAIKDVGYINILISTPNGIMELTKNGCYHNHPNAKCVIFPKGKTTWKGFQRPFEDGDIIYFITKNNNEYITIFKNDEDVYLETYIDIANTTTRCSLESSFDIDNIKEQRFATEEEKQKLFDAIKANGYHWNAETKTLEKLPKFKVGDKIKRKGDIRVISIKDVRDNYYIITIQDTFNNCYITDKLLFDNQDDYKLFSNKFDITTLKPFDKVLVRGDIGEKWTHDFFGFMNKGLPFVCVGHHVIQCIPYENNEHLLGTINDCDDFYKIWEK